MKKIIEPEENEYEDLQSRASKTDSEIKQEALNYWKSGNPTISVRLGYTGDQIIWVTKEVGLTYDVDGDGMLSEEVLWNLCEKSIKPVVESVLEEIVEKKYGTVQEQERLLLSRYEDLKEFETDLKTKEKQQKNMLSKKRAWIYVILAGILGLIVGGIL